MLDVKDVVPAVSDEIDCHGDKSVLSGGERAANVALSFHAERHRFDAVAKSAQFP